MNVLSQPAVLFVLLLLQYPHLSLVYRWVQYFQMIPLKTEFLRNYYHSAMVHFEVKAKVVSVL